MMKNRLHHESGEPIEEPIHPGQQRRIQQRQEVLSEDYFSSARVDQHTGWEFGLHLQVPRGGTHPNGVGSEVTFCFCSDLSLLQLVSFTVDSDPL